jgi:quinolinate synthase
MICPTMKMTTLEWVYLALERMEHVVTLPEEVPRKARKALDAMLVGG